ncbi:hypothetical protein [Thalassomonas sp. M1454]|uniref:hypothetical protein n=1 Tax=Thalassomonas sp. M1454 TaxID=2594477 RepID=UPI00117DE0D2|nr:hypothetical protein [Thalassomonas sp. M1454]TRX57179.1 hypothetical protein FNN08_06685 [Thalassomonas sp. M1454]
MQAFIRMEGFRTLFSSIEESSISQGLINMENASELEVTKDMDQLIKKSWEEAIKQPPESDGPDEGS